MTTLSEPAGPVLRERWLPGRVLPRSVHRVGRWARTGLILTLSLLASLLAIGFLLTRLAEDSPTGVLRPVDDAVVLLALLGGVSAAVALRWRHSSPYAVTLVTATLPLALPLDATASLFALAALLRTRTGRAAWACAGLVTVATVVALLRDVSGRTTESSVLKSLTSSHPPGEAVPVDLSLWVMVIAAAALVLASIGSGLFMHSRQDLVVTRERAEVARQGQQDLTQQLGRQAERDLIAREVHDVIGHRLSLLSLHAGGLEVAAGADPRMARSASLVRQSAQQAMEDLRSLLHVLREPDQESASRTATPALTDLPLVIEETVAGGTQVVSTVFLTQAEEADEALARAVYRIVQELLTNARRHAPGAPVRLLVQGGPAEGVRIETANGLTSARPGPAGNGLTGIAERAELLGGTLRSGLDEQDVFRAAVWLPWVPVEVMAQ